MQLKFLIVLLIIILAYLQYKLWVAQDGLVSLRHVKQQLAEQKTENEQLLKRNQALHAEVQDLKKGMAAIEELARKDLGMIKKGETFYQVIDKEKNQTKKRTPE